jgi:hypothetical protein
MRILALGAVLAGVWLATPGIPTEHPTRPAPRPAVPARTTPAHATPISGAVLTDV